MEKQETQPVTGPNRKRDFSQEEILETFEKLGLSDPHVRQRLLNLSKTEEPEQPEQWVISDSGTSTQYQLPTDAELESNPR